MKYIIIINFIVLFFCLFSKLFDTYQPQTIHGMATRSHTDDKDQHAASGWYMARSMMLFFRIIIVMLPAAADGRVNWYLPSTTTRV